MSLSKLQQLALNFLATFSQSSP